MLLSVVFTERPSKWIQSKGAGLGFCVRAAGELGLDRDGLGTLGPPVAPTGTLVFVGGGDAGLALRNA